MEVGKIDKSNMRKIILDFPKQFRIGIEAAKNIYLKAFPYALLHLETLWIIEPDFYKLTDNRLGFGKKIIWQKTF